MSLLRIALLKCDTFIPHIKQQFGDVDAQFVKLLHLSSLAKVETDTYECKEMQFPDQKNWDKYNGFLISGSRDSANDKEEWVSTLKKNIVELDKQKKKILGVCFGHQAVAVALGGKVEGNPKGWQVSQHSFSFNKDLPSVSSKKEEVSLLCLNKEMVTELPAGFTVFGSNALCPIQGLVKNNTIFTIQGHPEFTPDLIQALLLSRRGKLPDDVIDRGVSRANNPIDQKWLADLIITFFKHDAQSKTPFYSEYL